MNLRSVFRKLKKSSKSSQGLANNMHATESSSFDKTTISWILNKSMFIELQRLNIVSFNMLAPVYKRLTALDAFTGSRKRESQFTDVWKLRANKTIQFFENEITSNNADIIGLQEFWLDSRYANLFEGVFQKLGYQMFLLQRSGVKADAVATVVKKSQFHVLGSEDVYLCTIGDRVALILWVQHKQSGKHFLIANTHLSFPHNSFDRLNQIHQIKNLIDVMDKFACKNQIGHVSRVILGDFNVELNSAVCDHLRTMGYYSCFDVSPPSNDLDPSITPSTVPSSSSSSTASSPSSSSKQQHHHGFVSHRNHRQEDVGVDHIFIRPEYIHTSTMTADQDGSNNNNSNSSCCIQDYSTMQESMETIHCQPSILAEHLYPSPNTTTTDNSNNNNSEILSNMTEQLSFFVDDSIVLPKHISCHQWSEDFQISDHRPISTNIVLARRQQDSSTQSSPNS